MCLQILTVIISHGAIQSPLCLVHLLGSQSMQGLRNPPKKVEGAHPRFGLPTAAHNSVHHRPGGGYQPDWDLALHTLGTPPLIRGGCTLAALPLPTASRGGQVVAADGAYGARGQVLTVKTRHFIVHSHLVAQHKGQHAHGRKCYATPAFSGVPNAKRGEKRQSELTASPLPSRGAKRGRKCCITPAFSGLPKAEHAEEKEIISGYPTPAFSGAQKRAEMLYHPCILGGPQCQAWGEKEIVSGCLTPAFSGAQKRAKMLRHPHILGGPQCQARGGRGNRMGCLTPAFLGAQKRAKMLHHPYILGGSQKGTKKGHVGLVKNTPQGGS